MIDITYREEDFDYELRVLVHSFFPNQSFVVGREEETFHIHFDFAVKMICITFAYQSYDKKGHAAVSGEGDFHKRADKRAHPYRTYYKNRVKRLLFQMLCEVPEDILPEGFEKRIPKWGTLTGVRPAKIPMGELLDGKPEKEVENDLKQIYCCSDDKRMLCMEIAKREAALLRHVDFRNGYSLYIGIPFCPTTCLYCSFPSYPVEKFGHLTERYLEALFYEMEQTCRREADHGLTSVYLGGGTPTALSAGQLERLLHHIRSCFPDAFSREFTVEAGRPDSITKEKLQVMKKYGISRISVNPQTMQQKTLDLIGRNHTVEETKHAFYLAREAGFSNINMDVIIGLPGEGVEDFKETLGQIFSLQPDSVTVHSLVVKRASRLKGVLEELAKEKRKINAASTCLEKPGEKEQEIILQSEEERAGIMEQMLFLAIKELKKSGYMPYYMYRQKNSSGFAGSNGQENIGFAKEGKECLYNVLMMEEMQTILAFGAGASTKKYLPAVLQENVLAGSAVRRVENTKNIGDYISRIDEMVRRKKDFGIVS